MLRQPSGNSISIGLPITAEIEPVPERAWPVESSEETAVCCLCLDDCVPRGNALRIVEGQPQRRLSEENQPGEAVLFTDLTPRSV
jgi:hypothetical protein